MRSRLPHKRDSNHADVKRWFEQLYCKVADTADLGDSFPDLVVSRRGITWLIEVKQLGKKLKKGQADFMDGWPGGYAIVATMSDVEQVVAEMDRQADKLSR